MPELPPSLRTRFNLYLNILPVVDVAGQLTLFVLGIAFVLVAIIRAALQFSRTMQISSSQQQQHNQSKYASLRSRHGSGRAGGATAADSAASMSLTGGGGYGYDDYDYDDDDDEDAISYEMSEKCIRNEDDVVLYEVDLCTDENGGSGGDGQSREKAFMLEDEHAMTDEDEEDDASDDEDDERRSGGSEQRSMSYEDNATVVGLPSLVSAYELMMLSEPICF